MANSCGHWSCLLAVLKFYLMDRCTLHNIVDNKLGVFNLNLQKLRKNLITVVLNLLKFRVLFLTGHTVTNGASSCSGPSASASARVNVQA